MIPNVEYECCDEYPKKEDFPQLKPINSNHLNLDELNVAEENLKKCEENLNRIINQSFVTRHINILS